MLNGVPGIPPKGVSPLKYAMQLEAEIRRLNQACYDRDANACIQKAFDVQQMTDVAVITLSKEFGFGPERNHKFVLELQDTFDKFVRMGIEDSGVNAGAQTAREKILKINRMTKEEIAKAGDGTLAYTYTQMDRILKPACGKYFVPFDERYSTDSMEHEAKVNCDRILEGEKRES